MYSGGRGSTISCFELFAVRDDSGHVHFSFCPPTSWFVPLRWTEPRTRRVIPDLEARHLGCDLTCFLVFAEFLILLENLGSISILVFFFFFLLLQADNKHGHFTPKCLTRIIIPLSFIRAERPVPGMPSEYRKPHVWQGSHPAGANVAFHARKWPRV